MPGAYRGKRKSGGVDQVARPVAPPLVVRWAPQKPGREGIMTGKEKGIKFIRRQAGKPDRTIIFPENASLNHMLQACKDDGFKVLSHETTATPYHPDFVSTIMVFVEPIAEK